MTARPHRMPFALLLLVIIGGGVCVLLALTTATAASEVRERSLDAQNSDLRDRQQQLARDVAAKQAPAELARRAIELGLVPAGNPAFIRVNADGSVTVLGSPAAVTPPPAPAPRTTSSAPPRTTPATRRTTPARSTPARSTSGRTPTTPSTTRPTTRPTATPSATRSAPRPRPTSVVTLPGGPR